MSSIENKTGEIEYEAQKDGGLERGIMRKVVEWNRGWCSQMKDIIPRTHTDEAKGTTADSTSPWESVVWHSWGGHIRSMSEYLRGWEHLPSTQTC